MFANLRFIIAFSEYILGCQNTRPYRHTHTESPHEILKSTGFTNIVTSVLLVALVDGEIAFTANTLDWCSVEVRIMLLIPCYGLVEEAFTLGLLTP